MDNLILFCNYLQHDNGMNGGSHANKDVVHLGISVAQSTLLIVREIDKVTKRSLLVAR